VFLQKFVHEEIATADALEEQTLGAVVEEFVIAIGGVAMPSKDDAKGNVLT
jgi:hypothetical protein